jgi:hypothetical protein
VWVRPDEAQLSFRASTTSQWDNSCEPRRILNLGTWYHVVLVLESSLMQVFYDGELVCVTDFGAGEYLIESPNRVMGFPGQHQVHALSLTVCPPSRLVKFVWCIRSPPTASLCWMISDGTIRH